MKQLKKTLAPLTAFLIIVLAGSSAAALAANVTDIKVTGNRRIEADAITEKMSLKKGNPITPEAVRDDIRAIFALGYFEDVRVAESNGTLTIEVRERPVITSIKYEGSSEFETKDLEEATALKPFNVVSLGKIRAAQQAIAKKYEEKGYYLARATTTLKPIPNRAGEVELVFDITENEKVRIRKIFFLGNKIFTTPELKRIMMTSEGHVFSWATSGGTYREGAFDRDLGALAFFYGNEGYIEAKFAKPRVTLSQDRRYIDIFIDVDEGKQYFLGDVQFRGDLLFTEDELREHFKMKKGDVFSTGVLQQEVLSLTDKYGDRGYAFANVIPKPQTHEGSQVVDLVFDVEKGEKVYWGKISVTGNAKTHDKVIRRQLPFAEGELYNATKRKKGLEKIKRLGFFGADVNFLTSTPAGHNDRMDLEIRVAEKPTGTLNVSAGFGNSSGYIIGASISQNNLFGLGQQLSFNMNLQKDSTKQFSLTFADPNVFDSEWLAAIDLYRQENPVGGLDINRTFDQRLSGGSLRVGREIFENLSLYGTYKLEHSLLKNPINPAIFTDPTKDKESIISSVQATLAYDSRNNRLDPSGGEYLSTSGEFAGLGGRVFQKYSFESRLYRRLVWRFVYRGKIETSVLTNGLTDETVPDTERFRLGGVFSMRGYPGGSVGPDRELSNTRDKGAPPGVFKYVLGGTKKLFSSHEVEFPLIPEADIRAVFFFDVGNTWDTLKQASPALLANYGWGIRWYSPLGPLRFEWGYPFTPVPLNKDRGVQFNFIIAPTF